MRFKTKDLLVSVMPNREISEELKAKLCLWHTRICIRPTLWCRWLTWNCHPCTLLFTWCHHCSIAGTVGCGAFNSCGPDGSVCDPTIFCGGHSIWMIEDPADLVTLKEEMNGVLKQLDKLQKEGLPAEFSSRSDFDAAEEALEGALNELRRQKKGTKK